MQTLTIVCNQGLSRLHSIEFNEVAKKYGKSIEVIDRFEFANRHGWEPHQRLKLPALYIGGENERAVWVSCGSEGYNIFDYLNGVYRR